MADRKAPSMASWKVPSMGDGKDPSMAGWKVSWMADWKVPAMTVERTGFPSFLSGLYPLDIPVESFV